MRHLAEDRVLCRPILFSRQLRCPLPWIDLVEEDRSGVPIAVTRV